jgi:replicative DNA helicase
MSIERIVISNLIFNEAYTRKIIPFLKNDYFSDYNERTLYGIINTYFQKYNSPPSIEALAIELSNASINEKAFKECKEIISGLKKEDSELQWLVDQTEAFCQDKAIYNAISKSIHILDDKTGKETKGSIPQILSDALAVSFDTNIGHDYFDDADEQYAYYHQKTAKIPFNIDFLNKITDGGVDAEGTLNIILGGIHAGKTLTMCHLAAGYLTAGKNVLYISMEMSEKKIRERIDANLLDIPIAELRTVPKEMYDRKIARIKSKTIGKLKVKQYPTSGASSANFRYLISELKQKQKFFPDVVIIDYINICGSASVKRSIGSYEYIKAIAEELRGLAIELGIPFWSATQVTRGNLTSSDFGMDATSESISLPAIADFMMAIIVTDELKELNQMLVKQLKNRYADMNFNTRFVLGLDRSKMRLYDVEQTAQEGILDGPQQDKPIFDTTTAGETISERAKPKNKFGKKDFKGFL